MSALREWAASCSEEAHQAVAVSSWGKWKTATQVCLPYGLSYTSVLLMRKQSLLHIHTAVLNG